jgi:hypothetical protein
LEIQQNGTHLNKVTTWFSAGGHLVAAMSTHFEQPARIENSTQDLESSEKTNFELS